MDGSNFSPSPDLFSLFFFLDSIADGAVAALALGARVHRGWSNNDALALLGMTIDADTNELDAMTDSDAWAWHRRPLAPRARAAAARQVVVLARAYQKVIPAAAEAEALARAASKDRADDAKSDASA